MYGMRPVLPRAAANAEAIRLIVRWGGSAPERIIAARTELQRRAYVLVVDLDEERVERVVRQIESFEEHGIGAAAVHGAAARELRSDAQAHGQRRAELVLEARDLQTLSGSTEARAVHELGRDVHPRGVEKRRRMTERAHRSAEAAAAGGIGLGLGMRQRSREKEDRDRGDSRGETPRP